MVSRQQNFLCLFTSCVKHDLLIQIFSHKGCDFITVADGQVSCSSPFQWQLAFSGMELVPGLIISCKKKTSATTKTSLRSEFTNGTRSKPQHFKYSDQLLGLIKKYKNRNNKLLKSFTEGEKNYTSFNIRKGRRKYKEKRKKEIKQNVNTLDFYMKKHLSPQLPSSRTHTPRCSLCTRARSSHAEMKLGHGEHTHCS